MPKAPPGTDPLDDLIRQRAARATQKRRPAPGAQPGVVDTSQTTGVDTGQYMNDLKPNQGRPYAPPPTVSTVQAPPPANAGPNAAPSPTAPKQSNTGVPANGNVDSLAALKQQQQADYTATRQQLAADKAKALQQAGASAGAAGMGLDGATTALGADTARVADRQNTLTLADLRKSQGDEQFSWTQRQAALDDIESSENVDVDGDGMVDHVKAGGKIGDGNPEDFAQSGSTTTTVTGADGKPAQQAVPLDGPVTDATRELLPDGEFHLGSIKDGAFQKGSKYFGSDDNYDYYYTDGGSFYRVKR